MSKVRHVLGISGGKDSAALAIYLNEKYPQLDLEYYFADTGKELDETYEFLQRIEVHLGKKITYITAVENSPKDPFDHVLTMYGNYLPSKHARWCTRKLKIEPFEKFVGNDPVISYVAIRGDEPEREAYFSTKPNIQSIMPFRRNIWSKDVIDKILINKAIDQLVELYENHTQGEKRSIILETARRELSPKFDQIQKLNTLLELDTPTFNRVVFDFLKTTSYPMADMDDYPLLNNKESLDRADIFRLLIDSGVGKPGYHQEKEFMVNGKKGKYARSRSGCFFCFFQQRIEWVWLYEQHPDLFAKAMEYEKDGFAWTDREPLSELIKPERIEKIKEEYLQKTGQNGQTKSGKLLDILLDESEEEGCPICFI